MQFEELYNKGRSYPENFFYGDMLGNVKEYEFPEGTFLLGNTSEEVELLWGVNQLDDLRLSIEKIEKENQGINFIFRYAGNLNDVFEKKEIINQWGYTNKDINVGYFFSLDNISVECDCQAIEYLDKDDVYKFLLLEKEVFDSFNVSENELNDWLNNGDHIILVYKESNKIIGFIIIGLYGANNQNCFIRNVGVLEAERGKGIGKKLMLFGLKEAKEEGALKAMLWVGYDNVIARNMYEQIGFRLDEDEAEVVFQV
ncbi:GNAT family N-acetyltransferase [Proteiniborus sp.]|uniref:GNAT family N-acetyltransferase n=1 Tax=Proteiniborus sp. TaxID=2079015 RepID=UPI00332C54AC